MTLRRNVDDTKRINDQRVLFFQPIVFLPVRKLEVSVIIISDVFAVVVTDTFIMVGADILTLDLFLFVCLAFVLVVHATRRQSFRLARLGVRCNTSNFNCLQPGLGASVGVWPAPTKWLEGALPTLSQPALCPSMSLRAGKNWRKHVV